MKMTFPVLALSLSLFVVATPDPVIAGMLATAMQFNGMHEQRNRRQLRSAIGVNPSAVAWCGYFMGMVARRSGRQLPAGYGIASAWMRFGKAVSTSQARAGDIVVLRAGRQYHVGVLHTMNGSTAKVVGGNQSGRVQVSTFPRKAILSIRR